MTIDWSWRKTKGYYYSMRIASLTRMNLAKSLMMTNLGLTMTSYSTANLMNWN